MSVIGLKGPGNKSDAVSRLDGEMVELSLLLPFRAVRFGEVC